MWANEQQLSTVLHELGEGRSIISHVLSTFPYPDYYQPITCPPSLRLTLKLRLHSLPQLSPMRPFHNLSNRHPALLCRPEQFPLLDKGATVFASLFDINQPYHYARSGANGEQEREAEPVVVCVVDDGLNHIRANDGRLFGKEF